MGRKPPKLTDEDLKLWHAYTRQVRPLSGRRLSADAVAGARAPGKQGSALGNGKEKPAESHDAGQRKSGRASPSSSRQSRSYMPPPASRRDLPSSSPSRGSIAGLDRRNAERLRRGKLPIDGRIDLHGMTQAEAHAALHRFVHASALSGRRCLLVITGKGLRENRSDDIYAPEPGILRRMVPQWLREPGISTHVLAVETAARQHGGGGAYYVLLRRQRVSGIRP